MKPRNPPRKPSAKPLGGRPAKAEPAIVLASVPEPQPPTHAEPAIVDPLRILSSIAADEDAPAQARVAACKALLIAGVAGQGAPKPDTPEEALNRRTLALMNRGRAN